MFCKEAGLLFGIGELSKCSCLVVARDEHHQHFERLPAGKGRARLPCRILNCSRKERLRGLLSGKFLGNLQACKWLELLEIDREGIPATLPHAVSVRSRVATEPLPVQREDAPDQEIVLERHSSKDLFFSRELDDADNRTTSISHSENGFSEASAPRGQKWGRILSKDQRGSSGDIGRSRRRKRASNQGSGGLMSKYLEEIAKIELGSRSNSLATKASETPRNQTHLDRATVENFKNSQHFTRPSLHSPIQNEDRILVSMQNLLSCPKERNKDTNHANYRSFKSLEAPRERDGSRSSSHRIGSSGISKPSLSGLVSALEHLGTEEDLSTALSPDMKLNSSDCNMILKSLRNGDNLIKFFFWMKKNGKTQGNLAAYHLVFDVMGRKQKWKQIEDLLEEMKTSCQCDASCQTFNNLLHFSMREGSAEWATKLFHNMIGKGVLPNYNTYGMLMNIYQKSQRIREAEIVFEHMEASGIQCCRAYSSLITLYTRASLYEKAEQVINKMRARQVKPDRENWLVQINAYGQQKRVREAEEVMGRMLQSGIGLDTLSCNSMITVYGKANRFNSAVAWFSRIQEEGLQPDAVTYRSMIGACGKAGKINHALHFYEEMKGLGFRPSTLNFSTLISLHRRKMKHDEGILHILSDMKEIGCIPDFSTFDALVKAYERFGAQRQLPQALRLLQEAGWSPNLKCYSILIQVYQKGHLVEEALDAFNLTRKAGVMLGDAMFHNLIFLCKEAGRYVEAIDVFTEMRQSGITASLRSICTMIDIYGLVGLVKEGERLFEELKISGRQLDSVAYNVTMNMYLRAGIHQKALQVLKFADEHDGLEIDEYLFLSMLRVYHKFGMHKEAVNVYRKMVNSNIPWSQPLFSGVIHYCGRVLPVQDVSQVFEDMLKAHVAVNTITCNVMIDIYGKAGLLEKAGEVLRLAQEQNVADQVSYSTLIDACGKAKEFTRMEAVLWEMHNEGFRVSLEAYNSMLDAYGKAGHFGKVEDVLERMRRAGCDPACSTFNILINIYGRKGLMHELQDMLAKMEELGLNPDNCTYNTLICVYGYADMPDEAISLFRRMLDVGLSPDRVTYASLIAAFERNQNFEEAAKWSECMKEAGFSS